MGLDISQLKSDESSRVSLTLKQGGYATELLLKPYTLRTATHLFEKYAIDLFDQTFWFMATDEIEKLAEAATTDKEKERLEKLRSWSLVWNGKDVEGLCRLCFFCLDEPSKEKILSWKVEPFIDENGIKKEVNVSIVNKLVNLIYDDVDFKQGFENRLAMQVAVSKSVSNIFSVKKKTLSENIQEMTKSLLALSKSLIFSPRNTVGR